METQNTVVKNISFKEQKLTSRLWTLGRTMSLKWWMSYTFHFYPKQWWNLHPVLPASWRILFRDNLDIWQTPYQPYQARVVRELPLQEVACEKCITYRSSYFNILFLSSFCRQISDEKCLVVMYVYCTFKYIAPHTIISDVSYLQWTGEHLQCWLSLKDHGRLAMTRERQKVLRVTWQYTMVNMSEPS